MTLKKTIAGYFKEYEIDILKDNGEFSHKKRHIDWIDQCEVDMHPLEEAQVLAHWAIHDVKAKFPEKLTQKQEHEWLIEHGADFVKQKRAEFKKAMDALQPEIDTAYKKLEECTEAWRTHCDKCCSKGLNPDTTPEGKHDDFKKII